MGIPHGLIVSFEIAITAGCFCLLGLLGYIWHKHSEAIKPNKALLTLYATMTLLCVVSALVVWLDPCLDRSFMDNMAVEMNIAELFLESILAQVIFIITLD